MACDLECGLVKHNGLEAGCLWAPNTLWGLGLGMSLGTLEDFMVPQFSLCTHPHDPFPKSTSRTQGRAYCSTGPPYGLGSGYPHLPRRPPEGLSLPPRVLLFPLRSQSSAGPSQLWLSGLLFLDDPPPPAAQPGVAPREAGGKLTPNSVTRMSVMLPRTVTKSKMFQASRK